MGGQGLFVPKMHAVLHMLAFTVLFGCPDNARLGDQEKDHQPYVKRAVRRTRQWETTFEDEVLNVADRIDAMLQIRSEERAAFWNPMVAVQNRKPLFDCSDMIFDCNYSIVCSIQFLPYILRFTVKK